jgi:transposase
MKNTSALASYCVGIDVSKDKLDVCLMALYEDRSTKIKASKKFDNTATGIVQLYDWVQKHLKDSPVSVIYVMEVTGVYHEELAWYLFRKDATVAVEPPKQIKYFGISLGVKTKNDKIDAQVIARYGLSKPLRPWKPISKTIYDLRVLTRQRTNFQKQKTRLTNQMHALKHSGYDNEWVREQLLPLLKLLDEQIEAFEVQIHTIVETDTILKEKIANLCTIKGLGFLSAVIIVAETNGFASIYSQKQLVSFAGYDVRERQSGQYTGKSKISKQGNSHIRAALHFPAFNMVKYTKIFEKFHNRVMQRTNFKMKGYVAVQRKLLCLIYTLWKTNAPFMDNYEQTKAPKTIVEKHDASLLEIVPCETSPLSNANIEVFC